MVQPLGRERRSREGGGGAARRQLLHPAGGAAAAREVQSRTNCSSGYIDIDKAGKAKDLERYVVAINSENKG